MPEGDEDSAQLIDAYNKEREEVEELRRTRLSLQEERAGLLKDDQGCSSEELESQLADAEEEFKEVCAQGNTIERIMEATGSVLKELDANTFLPLKKDFGEYIAALTKNRYPHVEMNDCIPHSLGRYDEKIVRFDLLSKGTVDLVSLALRLAMAKFYLKGAGGFLMLDDPLVNLDPDRQKRTAELIRKFSEEKQLIVFTCHPSHAELMKGNIINMPV